MERPNANVEGTAYLSAISVKESFHPASVDFMPDRLDDSIQRVTKIHNELEGHCEKLATEELLREFSHIRKEIKNYLVVVKSIQEIKTKDAKMWEAVCFFLDPDADVAEEPDMLQQKEARKLLKRIAGFSDHSATILEGLVQKRLDYESEKVRLAMEQRKKKPSGGGGFFSKLGIKF